MKVCQDNMIFEYEFKEKSWQYQKEGLAWTTFWETSKSLQEKDIKWTTHHFWGKQTQHFEGKTKETRKEKYEGFNR